MTNQGWTIGTLLAGSYLYGSLPFGLWMVKAWKGVDLREVGSGNIGATNVGRICGPAGWLISFTFDVSKGLLPPLIGSSLGLAPVWLTLAALCAILGHNFSFLLNFKGGKGIATSLGALLGVAPWVGVGALSVFLIELLVVRYVSLGSLLAALSLPLFSLWLYPGDYARLSFCLLACMMAVYKHRANIERLRNGTEPKIHLGRQRSETPKEEETP